MIRLWALVLVAVLASPEPVLAHAPIKGIGAFYNGLLHPLLVPAHSLVIVGLGLLIGRHAPGPESRLGWPAFVVAVCGALVVGMWSGAALPDAVLIALALITASLVMFDLSSPGPVGALLAAAAGIAVGLNSSADLAGQPAPGAWVTLAGIAVGTVLWLSYIGGLAARTGRPWHRIAVRIAASWTMAISLIVLALWSVHGTTG